jgi:hypothetical protein
MIYALTHLNWVVILVLTVLCFGLGGIWYSPFLFSKAWMAEAKMTPEMWKADPGRTRMAMIGTLLLTLISTITLATLVSALHVTGALKGAEFGLVVAAGLVATRQGTNALFELKTLKHFLIVSGHDVVLLTIQGAILGVWR